MIFKKALTFANINHEIRLDPEINMSSILGYFQDMSGVIFLYFVNKNNNFLHQKNLM